MSIINTPVKIKDLSIDRRIIMPPMVTSKSNDGKVSEDLLEYYAARTKGGYLGLVITEHCFISRDGQASINQV